MFLVAGTVANQVLIFTITETKCYLPVVTLLTQDNVKLPKQLESDFIPHMHKMGPQRPKHYIFGDQFYSKNARILRFHEFLHFYSRKHMISSFYLKWTEFTKNFEFCSNLVWVPEDQ